MALERLSATPVNENRQRILEDALTDIQHKPVDQQEIAFSQVFSSACAHLEESNLEEFFKHTAKILLAHYRPVGSRSHSIDCLRLGLSTHHDPQLHQLFEALLGAASGLEFAQKNCLIAGVIQKFDVFLQGGAYRPLFKHLSELIPALATDDVSSASASPSLIRELASQVVWAKVSDDEFNLLMDQLIACAQKLPSEQSALLTEYLSDRKTLPNISIY